MTTHTEWANRRVRGYVSRETPKPRLVAVVGPESVPKGVRLYWLGGKYYADAQQLRTAQGKGVEHER